ncbi:MAG: lysylphosphatidylglycerol synthase transmembrane domain-containing protein [Microscillaceae bacterium]|nr:lysylphosphatidylglycerol synthase transmembrane domain-containing protein [Microscillaceae bacterium]
MEIQKNVDSGGLLKQMHPSRIIIPILIGLAMTAYLIYSDLKGESEAIFKGLAQVNYFWLGMALLVLLFRDLFYIIRIRYLTDKRLTWKGSFYTIVLWEFSSALSPSAVGGTAIASFLLLKEGIGFGKSLAYVIVSAILDNSYFIVFGAIVLILNYSQVFPQGDIFHFENADPAYSTALKVTFYTSYTVITLYNLLMIYGLFVKPEFIKWLFVKITSIRWFKRWKRAALKQGEEVILSSAELKGKSWFYWATAIFSTILIWTSRYFIVNCLISAFVIISPGDHTFILSRHVVLWVLLLIGITPGASGIAEFAFKNFFIQFAGALSGIIAVLWRVLTYYPYLLLGVIFLPRWVKRVFYDKPQEG